MIFTALKIQMNSYTILHKNLPPCKTKQMCNLFYIGLKLPVCYEYKQFDNIGVGLRLNMDIKVYIKP